MDNKEDKVVVKLNKEYLSSEIRERKLKTTIRFLIVVLFFACLVIVFLTFKLGSFLFDDSYGAFSNNKVDAIKTYIEDQWLYGNDYEDLDSLLDEKMYYGITQFDEDPYTTYMNPNEMNDFSSSINKIQLGVGISYYHEYKGYPLVLDVYKDSGAYNAGIKKGDHIIKISGTNTKECDDDSIRALVLGDPNSYVTLTVERNGQIIDFECERKEFDSTASASLYGDVVVLTLSSFGENTAETIDNELSIYKDYHKLIIDERDNTGGYQDALLKIAGLFLEDGTEVMKEIDKKGNSKSFVASYNSKYYNFDTIMVLTNEYTASAAEVFAICMKEMHPNCVIAGNKSFGKGVVQSNYVLKDGSYIKVTTSYWTSPNGVSLKDGGIVPDIELKHDDVYYLYYVEADETLSLEYDSVSTYIENAQTILKFLGYDVLRCDGYFDKTFENSLNIFKESVGLEANGILDYDTYKYIVDKYNTSDKDVQLEEALNLI